MTKTVALFDMDGVLVRPGGYRAATRATVLHYLSQMGLDVYAPDNETMELFESIGITNEWDMITLSLAHVLDALCAVIPLKIEENWRTLQDVMQAACFEIAPELPVDYPRFVRSIKPWLVVGLTPGDALLQKRFAAEESGIRHLFPHFYHHPLLVDLLACSRDVEKFEPLRLFQNFILGREVLLEVYGFSAMVNDESYLKKYDSPQLKPDNVRWIKELQKKQLLFPVIYSARPSLPPREIKDKKTGYSPEAEIAAKMIGMEEFPLIGYGRLAYLAEKMNVDPAEFVKPALVHPVAAIAAACWGQEWPALLWAGGAIKGGQMPQTDLVLPEKMNVHVFEDSITGMNAAKDAVQFLDQLGIKINLFLWGIANESEKIAALHSVGATVMGDVNQAVRFAFSEKFV